MHSYMRLNGQKRRQWKYEKYKPDTFPIQINPFTYTIGGDDLLNWQEKNGITIGKTAEQVFNEYKEKYKIANTDVEDVRKIIGLRYEIEKKGYTSKADSQL